VTYSIRTQQSLRRCIRIVVVLATAALFVAVPPVRADVSCENNFGQSGIASTGNSVVLVASTQGIQGGNLYYFWQPFGSPDWNRELVAEISGGNCDNGINAPWGYVSNAIAWTGDSVVIAALNASNGGIYFWVQGYGGTQWDQQTVATGPPGCCSYHHVLNGVSTPQITGYSIPSIAWTGSSVVIAACDQSNDLHYWFEEKGQRTWYHQLVATNGCYLQPSIAATDSAVVIAAVCPSGLCYYWQAFGSGSWGPQVVDTARMWGASPSIAWTGDAVVIAADQLIDGDDNNVTFYWQSAGARWWRQQQVTGPGATGGGLELTSPGIAEAAGSVIVAAAQHNLCDNGLNYWWAPTPPGPLDSAQWTWTQQSPPPGGGCSGGSDTSYSANTTPGSIAWTGESAVITSTTNCGDLDYWWQQKSTINWNHERVITNPNWPPGTC
jgi:hypothetical protein